jgi:hypothetical protein
VDAATVAVLYAELSTDQLLTIDVVRLLVILYNALAFGLQVPLGILCDRFRADKPMALAGLGVTILAVSLSAAVRVEVVLLRVGPQPADGQWFRGLAGPIRRPGIRYLTSSGL